MYKKAEKMQNHHIVPVSLRGKDIAENIFRLLDSSHSLTHQILDMNSRLFYALSRKAKLKTNHKLLLSPEDLQYRFDTQDLYFERVPRLPKDIKDAHLMKMNELVWYERNRLIKLTNTPITSQQSHITFPSALEDYHETQKLIAKELQVIMRLWLSEKGIIL